MRAWGSAAAVIAALRDEAAADIERLEREAAAELEAIRAATGPVDAAPDAEARLSAARRAAAEHEADEDWQDTVGVATDRDAWIGAIVQQGGRVLATAPDAASWTAALAREAVAALPGDACVLVIPAALAGALGDGWRVALEHATGTRVTVEPGPLSAGCVARTPDGRVTFDNSLEARQRRVHAAWRRALARLYDAATAEAPAGAGEPAAATLTDTAPAETT